jgi:hypothetical protein
MNTIVKWCFVWQSFDQANTPAGSLMPFVLVRFATVSWILFGTY